MGTVIICVILCIVIFFSIKSMCKKHIKAKKSGGCCCSCGCSGCSTAFKCSDKEINKN